MFKIKNIKSILLILVLFASIAGICQTKKFTVVLDAGHGGKDTGCRYHGFVEKDIALSTTLKVGELLEKNTDIKVIYTRKTDIFIELVDRPKVGNRADANLFISIHCNGVVSNEASGTETFVMGLARSKMNLEVAKMENSVILLEDNYKVKYKGFNPNNPESLIGLKIMQEEYLNNSISLASKVQNNFTDVVGRKNRGVKQTPLWVLDASYMPSILIELGFLSNQEEGDFLNSDEGQNTMAKQIADAVISYKNNYSSTDNEANDTIETNTRQDTKRVIDSPRVVKEIEKKEEHIGTIYKIQLCASNKKVGLESKNFKGLDNISMEKEGKVYKYFSGNETDIDEIKKQLKSAKAKGYKSAFVVTYINGEKK